MDYILYEGLKIDSNELVKVYMLTTIIIDDLKYIVCTYSILYNDFTRQRHRAREKFLYSSMDNAGILTLTLENVLAQCSNIIDSDFMTLRMYNWLIDSLNSEVIK